MVITFGVDSRFQPQIAQRLLFPMHHLGELHDFSPKTAYLTNGKTMNLIAVQTTNFLSVKT
jgi:hypothetical protein